MSFLADTWHLFLGHARATARMPIYILITLVQPVIWIVLFGQLFEKITEIPGFGADSYLQFLTPGVVVMAALFGAAFSGMALLQELQGGVLSRMLVTPVSRGAIIAAHVLHAGVNVVLQAAVILLIALLLGASVDGGVAGAGVILLSAALLGAAIGAVSNALALLTRQQEAMISTVNFIALPLLFLSAALFPEELMPDWMGAAAEFNPVNWTVVAARAGMEGADWGAVATGFALLAGFAAVCGALATASFGAYRRTL